MKHLVFVLALCACSSPEVGVVKGAGMTGAGGAAGSLFGPVGAAIGAIVGYLWHGASAVAEPAHLGTFASIGNAIDQFITLVIVVVILLVIFVRRWRVVALDFLLGLPKVIASFLRGDAATAKTAAKDMIASFPRFIGAMGESHRTRPAPKQSGE
jgi:hypothetical protein